MTGKSWYSIWCCSNQCLEFLVLKSFLIQLEYLNHFYVCVCIIWVCISQHICSHECLRYHWLVHLINDRPYIPFYKKTIFLVRSLRMYNSLVERCFGHCIDNFRRKTLDKQEESCVRHCAEKFLKHSMRVSLRFTELNQGGMTPDWFKEFPVSLLDFELFDKNLYNFVANCFSNFASWNLMCTTYTNEEKY